MRATLHAFLMLVKDAPGSVSVQIATNGDMTLSAPAAAILAEKIMGPGRRLLFCIDPFRKVIDNHLCNFPFIRLA